MADLEKPIIKIEDLSFTYPDGRNALKNIDLSIMTGEKIGIIGSNGAGKSTLIFHLNGIFSGNGAIHINEMLINKENLKKIRSIVGIVFQDPDDQLFSPTVLDDVAYGPIYQGIKQELVVERVEAALAAVQMQGFEKRAPFHLSVGEKKRIAIASVLAMQPEILVLDEPSAGLDPKARRELIELLSTFPQTLIVASHDLDLVKKLTKRTIILSSGKITAAGITDDILSNQEILAKNGLV